jgi:spore germination cell wall hydrolase CwlJ-like protein
MPTPLRTLLLTATVAFASPVSPTSVAISPGEAGAPAKKDESTEGPTPASAATPGSGGASGGADRAKKTGKGAGAPRAKRARQQVVDAELRCLALNIYHEARSEPERGQQAVAAVTLNRVKSQAFPGSVCAVVKQGGEKRNRCQFSWWCDGRSDKPTETAAWERALELGRESLLGLREDPTSGALYYHADHVRPRWSRTFQRTARIGDHIFYRPIRGPALKLASSGG